MLWGIFTGARAQRPPYRLLRSIRLVRHIPGNPVRKIPGRNKKPPSGDPMAGGGLFVCKPGPKFPDHTARLMNPRKAARRHRALLPTTERKGRVGR